jgi:5-methylcytosine-specific restriction enzyme A
VSEPISETTRAVPEWIGKTPDSQVPPRVRVRVFKRYGGRCQCGCDRPIRAGEPWDAEDTIAIINGGERREKNLKPWLTEHHPKKTAADVAEKSMVYRKTAKNLGIKPKKGRPFPGSKASGFKKKMDGSVERRS